MYHIPPSENGGVLLTDEADLLQSTMNVGFSARPDILKSGWAVYQPQKIVINFRGYFVVRVNGVLRGKMGI